MPDGRIEKMAHLDKLLGHKTEYLGTETRGATLGIFDRIHCVHQGPYMHLGIPTTIAQQRKITNCINSVNPDIIHLHNVLLYDIVARSGYPFILDDHEYLSKEVYYDEGRRQGIRRKIAFPFQLSMWRRREKHAAHNVPIITVSNPIAEHYNRLGGSANVIPNFPSQFELDLAKFSKKVDELTSVYQGTTNIVDVCSYRDSTGFVEFFKKINKPLVCIGFSEHISENKVSFTGYIPHMQLFTEMSKYHIGIIPWRKHPFHEYCCPNKAYYYAHCGMLVIVTSNFKSILKRFQGHCLAVKRFEELKPLLDKLEQDIDYVITRCEETRKFAQEHFIFEKFIDILEETYRNV